MRLWIAVLVAGGSADGAEFWLSLSDTAPPGPEAPDFIRQVGVTTTLRVWGRPTAGRQFSAVSLNVVANATGVDFVDGSYTFFNAIDGGVDRFEFVRASATLPDLTSDAPPPAIALGAIDSVRGLNGFTLEPGPNLRGPGPYCATGEIGCELAGDGQPAWLLAELDVAALAAGGAVDLFLQLGDRGVVERTLAPGDYAMDGLVDAADHAVWAAEYGGASQAADGNGDRLVNAADYTVWRDHLGEAAVEGVLADTDVSFGLDGMGGAEPTYDAEDPLDRNVTLLGDDPDATITVVAPSLAVPEPSGALSAWLMAFLGLIRNGRRRPTRG